MMLSRPALYVGFWFATAQCWLVHIITLWGLSAAGLTEILHLEDKAVLNSCMHVFCVSCISRWAAKKRVCPLCKVRQDMP